MPRSRWSLGAALLLAGAVACIASVAALAGARQKGDDPATTTPIKHLVVIFQENVSYDHYFGAYPNATNPAGEPAFTAAAGTPAANGFTTALLTSNPNLNVANGAGAANPFRLDRSQAATADQGHSYTPEQEAEDNGLADLFPKFTG